MSTQIQQQGTQWLNPTSKITLTKYVISSVTIFQCATLLAPKGVADQMEKSIMRFLWEGGKINKKKFHRINWSTIGLTIDRDGLAIRDPSLKNIALGAKVAQRLVSSVNEWWKCALLSRYLNGSRLRCLDSPLPTSKGSPIWKLIKITSPLIQSHLSWLPGNGKTISLWYDNITGKPPLETFEDLQSLKDWFIRNDIIKLLDLTI